MLIRPMRLPIRQLRFTVLICALIGGAGCAIHQQPGDSPWLWQDSGFHPSRPGKPFESYEAAFRYIARWEQLPSDRHTLFLLAADSTLERTHWALTGDVMIVRAEYYGQSQFGIRGVRGQGRFYVFQTGGDGWRLVGICHGDSYRWEAVGDMLRIITTTHFSVNVSDETIYTWKGQLFE
jgi:hypothetical protein